MARKSLNDISPIKPSPKFLVCPKCSKKYKIDQFMKSSRFPGGYIPMCKECLYEFAIDANGLSRQGLIDLCKYLNLPFVQNDYDECKSKYVNPHQPKQQLSMYLCIKMKAKKRMDLHFKDSIFTAIDGLDDEIETDDDTLDLRESFTPGEVESVEEQVMKTQSAAKQRKEIMAQLKAKWGNYDSYEYLTRCEALYQEIVNGGYIIKSAMHDISVKHYCKLQIKWDIAQESDNYDAMKELKQPLKDARSDARLNPNQFNAADFQNAGANSFGEVARMVAQRDGFMPLPMKYYKKPNDALDFLVWELINYMRHVLGQPEVEYEEVYQHYINRINAFNEKYNADIEHGDLGDLDESTKGKHNEFELI